MKAIRTILIVSLIGGDRTRPNPAVGRNLSVAQRTASHATG